MIITDISAQDILKYKTLEIQDIPEDGIIAIEGHNESGKSSIGETICFALYGRSFSLEQVDLEKLIRWGEPRCTVRLRFHNGKGRQYEITRLLDRDGNHAVRLSIAGQEEEPIARGVEPVENALADILGYGYEEFIESFYLAQREITTPHPHSDAVKRMAGIKLIEQVTDEFEDEIESEQSSITGTQEKLAENESDQEALGIEPGLLESLETEKQAEIETGKSWQVDREALEVASAKYQENIPQLRAGGKSRGRARLFLFISLVMAVLLGVAWWLLTRMPEVEASKSLQALLAGNLPQWGEQHLPWLLYGAGAFVILLLVFWGRSASLSGRMNRLQEGSPLLADRLMQAHGRQPNVSEPEQAPATAPTLLLEPAAMQAEAGLTADQPVGGEPPPDEAELISETPIILSEEVKQRPEDGEVSRLRDRIVASHADPAEVSDLVGRELGWIDGELQRQQTNIEHLGQAIENENERLKKDEHYNQVRESHEQQIANHEQRIHVREIATELLQGTSRHVSHSFNRDLRELVGRTLPMFTEGRYEHLKIDEELDVRVFSNDKRDFMALEEISSGTQRQIMLAVRLALSQELVNGMVKGKQFIFLDEPFAFFDQERTRSALKVLPQLSKEITQIWVVAQSFPEGYEFERIVNCTIGETDLQTGA